MRFILSMLLLVLFAAPLSAQSRDEAAVIAVVQTMFDAMTAQDTATMWSVIDRDARLVQTLTRDGTPTMRSVPMAQFMESVASHQGDPWVERFHDPVVRIHDNLASIWIAYTFHLGERLSHCGEDNFQLARVSTGWKIIALADTQRREGCVAH